MHRGDASQHPLRQSGLHQGSLLAAIARLIVDHALAPIGPCLAPPADLMRAHGAPKPRRGVYGCARAAQTSWESCA
eukprot:2913479-Prymnesium_polylepis.1